MTLSRQDIRLPKTIETFLPNNLPSEWLNSVKTLLQFGVQPTHRVPLRLPGSASIRVKKRRMEKRCSTGPMPTTPSSPTTASALSSHPTHHRFNCKRFDSHLITFRKTKRSATTTMRSRWNLQQQQHPKFTKLPWSEDHANCELFHLAVVADNAQFHRSASSPTIGCPVVGGEAACWRVWMSPFGWDWDDSGQSRPQWWMCPLSMHLVGHTIRNISFLLGANTLNYHHHSHQPFQSRPLTCCYGMVGSTFPNNLFIQQNFRSQRPKWTWAPASSLFSIGVQSEWIAAPNGSIRPTRSSSWLLAQSRAFSRWISAICRPVPRMRPRWFRFY